LERGFDYGKKVVSGEIPACGWVRLAAQRHFDETPALPREVTYLFHSPIALSSKISGGLADILPIFGWFSLTLSFLRVPLRRLMHICKIKKRSKKTHIRGCRSLWHRPC
jgi:hypothetical protein